MPFLSRSYDYTYDNTVNGTLIRYEKTQGNYVNMTTLFERAELSSMFYTHLKETLQELPLDITFNTDKRTINIFGMDFYIACCIGSTNTNLYKVRPVIFPPRLSNPDLMFRDRAMYASGTSINDDNAAICGKGNQENAKQIHYTFKIYYNTNFIICNYESMNRYEIPYFCLVQGNVVGTNRKAVYLSECINYSGNGTNVNVYHRITIPEDNDNPVIAYDYLPAENNTKLWELQANSSIYGFQRNYIFDCGIYPKRDLINKVRKNNPVNVFMKKLTSYNGMIQYDNAYDVSIPIDTITTTNLSKITKGQRYTISGHEYYCPGTTHTGFTSQYSNQRLEIFMFKL